MPLVRLSRTPTAQQLPDDRQRTPSSSLISPVAVPAGLGVLTLFHFLPFQCRASLRPTPVPTTMLPKLPTAQQLADETQARSAGYLSVTVKLLLWSLGLDVTAMAWPPVLTSL
jgi:hypothetical protein